MGECVPMQSEDPDSTCMVLILIYLFQKKEKNNGGPELHYLHLISEAHTCIILYRFNQGRLFLF